VTPANRKIGVLTSGGDAPGMNAVKILDRELLELARALAQ
jgi:hypothetical protein